MLYIISGLPRSGTSAMMEAISTGGMKIIYSKDYEAMLIEKANRCGGPKSNQYYREPSLNQFNTAISQIMPYDYCIKMLVGRVSMMNSEIDFNILFLMRPIEEVRQSLEIHFSGTTNSNREFCNLDAEIEAAKSLKNCKSVTIIQFHDFMENPVGALTTLQTNGWPIDPEAGAKVVDQTLVNFGRSALNG